MRKKSVIAGLVVFTLLAAGGYGTKNGQSHQNDTSQKMKESGYAQNAPDSGNKQKVPSTQESD